MGRKYNEKVKKHFWMLVVDTMSSVNNAKAFKQKYESAFKVDSREALKLYLDTFWTELFSLISNINDPNEMKEKLEPLINLDKGRIKDNIWELLVFSFSKTHDKKNFREVFEPLLRINHQEALKFVEEPLWKDLYSIACDIKNPEELDQKLGPIVQLEIKNAAEVIKEINPEKYKLLSYYK